MFNEFQIQNLIDDIQKINSINFLEYQTDGKQFTFFLSSEDDAFGYIHILMDIFLKYDLITMAAFDEDEYLTFETVTFNRFGVN